MVEFDFEWDVNKAIANKRKHGVSFEQASCVFLDPMALTVYDAHNAVRRNYLVPAH